MAIFANQQPNTSAPPTEGTFERSEAPMQSYQDFVDNMPDPTPMDTTTPATGGGGGTYVTAADQAFKGGIEQAGQGFNDVASGSHNPLTFLKGVGRIGAGAIGAALSPVAPLFSPIGAAVSAVANPISDNPTVQKFANSKVGQNVAGAAENVQNYSTIAGTVGGGMEAPKVPGAISDLSNGIADAFSPTPPDLDALANDSVTPDVRTVQQDIAAGKDYKTIPVDENGVPTSPANAKGTIPRVADDGQGNLSANLNKNEIGAQNELKNSPAWQKLETENPNASSQAQANAIEPEIKAKDTALDAKLAAEPARVSFKNLYGTLGKVLMGLKDKGYAMEGATGADAVQSYLTQLSDSWGEITGKKIGEPTSLDDIYDIKQDMAKKYIARQGDTKLGSVPDAQLRALDIIQKTANQAFTDFIDSQTKNVNLKAELQSATDLHNASDILVQKAKTEPIEQPSIYGKFAKNHPTLARNIGYFGRAVARHVGFGLLK